MPDPPAAPTAEERADSINLGAPAETEEGAVRQWVADEIRAAVAAETERCAVACINRWTEETDLTRRNALSRGCIASAAAIRAEPADAEEPFKESLGDA